VHVAKREVAIAKASGQERREMQYPHWLMVAGALLVVIGLIGLAFYQNKDREPDDKGKDREPDDKGHERS